MNLRCVITALTHLLPSTRNSPLLRPRVYACMLSHQFQFHHSYIVVNASLFSFYTVPMERCLCVDAGSNFNYANYAHYTIFVIYAHNSHVCPLRNIRL